MIYHKVEVIYGTLSGNHIRLMKYNFPLSTSSKPVHGKLAYSTNDGNLHKRLNQVRKYFILKAQKLEC